VDPLADELCELERRLLDPNVRADGAALDALLDPEFIEFGSSGRVWTREASIAGLVTERGAIVEVSDMVARAVAPGAMLVTYVAVRSDRRALRSSLWIDRGGGWRLRFHQGTAAFPRDAG
jgi:ribonuclease HI